MVKKSPENTTPAIVDNVEALEAKLAQMREAQALFATYTQEQVDKIFYEAAMAANKASIPLAKMAIEETGRGVLEDKVIKNTTPQSTSTTLTRTPRPVVSWSATRLMASPRSPSPSVSWAPSSRRPTPPPLRSSRR